MPTDNVAISISLPVSLALFFQENGLGFRDHEWNGVTIYTSKIDVYREGKKKSFSFTCPPNTFNMVVDLKLNEAKDHYLSIDFQVVGQSGMAEAESLAHRLDVYLQAHGITLGIKVILAALA